MDCAKFRGAEIVANDSFFNSFLKLVPGEWARVEDTRNKRVEFFEGVGAWSAPRKCLHSEPRNREAQP